MKKEKKTPMKSQLLQSYSFKDLPQKIDEYYIIASQAAALEQLLNKKQPK